MNTILGIVFSLSTLFDYQYVGYHECTRVGVIESESVVVYPASVELSDRTNNYILFKGINNDGTISEIACVKKG